MDATKVGDLIKIRRKEFNLRQEDVAEMSGITKRTIYNIEEGKGNPSFKSLSTVCNMLGLEIIVAIKVIG